MPSAVTSPELASPYARIKSLTIAAIAPDTLPLSEDTQRVLQAAGVGQADLRSWVSKAFERAVWAKTHLNSKLPEMWGSTISFESPHLSPIVNNNIAFATHDPICAERQALKQALETYPNETIKAITVINAQYDDPYLKTQASCHVCMETFYNLLAHNQGVTPETLLIYVAQNAQKKPELIAKPLKEIFPSLHRKLSPPSQASQVNLHLAPVEISKSAAMFMGSLDHDTVRQAMIDAKVSHQEAVNFKRSGRNGHYTGSTLVFLPQHQGKPVFVSASSLHPKQTTPLFADIAAASKAVSSEFESLKTPNHKPLPSLKMAAYYSEHTHELPRPLTLGQLYKLSGNPNLLIVTLEQGILKVRSLSEWQSVQYQKAHDIER
ncbi:MAG: hypothetical protein VKK59_01780 [Vampirovibrionales bacterium]|nr:hypothetical protein [Vampirovibrionales bacterium]